MSTLQGKVALVTGASKGIGAAIARELAARGASVAVNYATNRQAAEKVVEEIRAAGGEAIAVQANVADPESANALAKTVAAQFGPIDIVVNNAGIYEFLPLEEITLEHFHRQFDVNVLGLLLVTKAAVALFNPAGGSIVNIGSLAGRMSPADSSASVYSATKSAVDAITITLSKELGPRKIRINAINPGLVETEGLHTAGIMGSGFEKSHADATPLGRIAQPQEIATIAAFLASADAGWVNGQLIYAAGGLTR